MNIKEAKQEIIHTVRAYLQKDETGAYEIPPERQRPILLMGPPGIGKTAIMEQAARECGINLVSYTITHHTRQSAIGLPFISEREFGGEKHAVTEYTMSEIIAAVYEQMERSGIKEGILFLDEINCVSETLAPTMLQFLQYKTFGNHHLPDGFLIVTAGNPPQYNQSVRDFDIVTLDRLKRIFIEEDYPVWKEYAYRIGIHGAILAYLEIRKEHFYSITADIDGKRFVTARGWEDLSRVMKVYEELGLLINYGLVVQYLQDEEIARSFANYYELYQKYKNVYRVADILDGKLIEASIEMKNAPFDEKLSMLGLMIDCLNQEFRDYAKERDCQEKVLDQLKYLREDLKAEKGTAFQLMEKQEDSFVRIVQKQKKAGLLSREEEKLAALVQKRLRDMIDLLRIDGSRDARTDFTLLKTTFDKNEATRKESAKKTGEHLTNAFAFLVRSFGEGQELVIFLSELAAGYYSLRFVSECGNDAYYKYNRLLLLKDRKEKLKEEVMELMAL